MHDSQRRPLLFGQHAYAHNLAEELAHYHLRKSACKVTCVHSGASTAAGSGGDPRASSTPKISVIVPVRDCGDGLERLLAALRLQTLTREEFEVIIGDDGSTDGVPQRATEIDARVRVTTGPPLTSYAARNRAVGESQAPHLAFCDADCVPDREWLERGLAALATADIVAGRIRFELSKRNVWAFVEMDAFKDHARQVKSANAETANLFVRRSTYDLVGGFDASLPSHGDFDFVARCVAAGAKLAYGPDAIVTHATRSSARWFLKKTWISSWAYGVREGRAGRRPYGTRLRWWIPLISRLRARRRFEQPFGLDSRWLIEHDVTPNTREQLAALPIMYLAVPYLQGVAQFAGWIEGKKQRARADVDDERVVGL
jgi:glycosyltransferase involved in cell wall biosynthesis